MSSRVSIGSHSVSDSPNNIFSKNIFNQTQSSLFGSQDNKPPDTKNNISSSLFQKGNNDSLFSNNNLLNNPNQNDDKKEGNNIFTNKNIFSSGISNDNNIKFLFGNPKNENEINKNKEDPNKNLSTPLFGLNQEKIKNENENNIKNQNKNEIIKEDKKPNFELFSSKNKEEAKLSIGQQPSNIEGLKLFQFNGNKKENNKSIFNFNVNEKEKEKEKRSKLFNFDINENGKNTKIFEIDENEKGKENNKLLFHSDLNEKEKNKKSFLFNGKEKGKNQLFFNFDNDNKEENKQPNINNNDNKEENKQPDRINNEESEDKNNENKNIFGTPKKETEKINILKVDDKQDEKQDNKQDDKQDNKEDDKQDDKNDEFVINTNFKKNNLNNQDNINRLSSSQRIEDNEEVQKALQNLYFSDILLPNKLYNQSFLDINNNNNKNKMKKRSRPIDFTLLIEIEGTTNINDKGIIMTCKSDETMINLMKQVKTLVKKKYKMNSEQNDLNNFEFNLIKNSKKLPINERELIGDYIRNKDIIIASFIHQNSDTNEENEKEEEKSEETSENFEKKNLCPKDKLPVLIRPGYYMKPNEYDISRMTIDEINNVKDFEIYNENGKIHFDNAVSLYGVNFDKLFNIKHDLIEYEKGEWCHSSRGTNFNIPATITLYNIFPNINLSNGNAKRQYIEFLKEKCHKNFYGTFISFDFDKGELKYKIPYFY